MFDAGYLILDAGYLILDKNSFHALRGMPSPDTPHPAIVI